MAYEGCDVTHLSPVPTTMKAQEIITLCLRPVNQKRISLSTTFVKTPPQIGGFSELRKKIEILTEKPLVFQKINLQISILKRKCEILFLANRVDMQVIYKKCPPTSPPTKQRYILK